MFKGSLLTKLHKPGKPKGQVSSYRPSSLTCCLGKILEKIVTERVKKWTEEKNINKQQNAFRAKRGTNDNIYKLIQSNATHSIKCNQMHKIMKKN